MQCSDTFIKIWALDFMPDKARAIRDLWCRSWNFYTQGKLYIQPHAKHIQTNTIKYITQYIQIIWLFDYLDQGCQNRPP